MQFGSVCSGIEAASVAWAPLGWKAAWLAEIEPFPCAVLAHHYPDVPNFGDMTTIARRVLTEEVPAPDVFCGGTPCQAFSVAGLRESLADERGNLTLKFVEIADAIDHVRTRRGDDECVIFYENVPGILSTKDNAFGCFLGGLAGEDGPLEPPGGKWANAGAVYGPKRAVAWRVLDAQYFALAQRRRRVFVVASARKGFDPAQVLFEWDGVRRDSAPSREARQTTSTSAAASTAGGGTFACGGIGSYTSASASATLLKSGQDLGPGCETIITMAHGQGGAEIGFDRGPTPTCNHEAPIAAYVTHSLRGEGFDASEDGTGRGTPLVPCLAPTLTSNGDAHSGYRDADGLVPMAFDTTQITSAANYSSPKAGDPCHPLAAGAHAPAIAFQSVDHGADASSELSPTIRASDPMAVAYTTKLCNTGSNNAGKIFEERTTCLDANSPPPALLTAMQVRRLTPTEAEKLQGFEPGYTAIPWRGKPADRCPDGPRYKALGNSWAIPCVSWIGERIARQINSSTTSPHPAGFFKTTL